jgi:hypothetical protein
LGAPEHRGEGSAFIDDPTDGGEFRSKSGFSAPC